MNLEFVELLVTDNSSVIETTLNNTLDLVFLIHGWTDSYLDDWVRTLVNQFVEYNDANICVVDWSRLAFMKYLLSAQATLPVGNYLGSFIQNLTDNGIFDISQITLIGHSMGAHVAGIAGFYLNSTVPTIIGLDPAGPAFTKFPLRPINERLDATDASFVQVIHTDRYFIGSNMDLGTEDFYPNGGFAPQPGCEVSINNSPINYRMILTYSKLSTISLICSLNSSQHLLQSLEIISVFHRITQSIHRFHRNQMQQLSVISAGSMLRPTDRQLRIVCQVKMLTDLNRTQRLI